MCGTVGWQIGMEGHRFTVAFIADIALKDTLNELRER